MTGKAKVLPEEYSDTLNDILQEAYAKILENMNPENEHFVLFYGRYDKETLLKVAMDEPEDVKALRDFLVQTLRDRLRNKNYKFM